MEWLVFALDFCLAVSLLRWLLHNPAFLHCWLGRHLVVMRAWGDLTGVAFAFDVSGGSDREQAIEATARSVTGRVLVDLTSSSVDWYPDKPGHVPEIYSITCTYEKFLKNHVFNCADQAAPEFRYEQMREKLLKFADDGEKGFIFREQIADFQIALQNKAKFSFPFQQFLEFLSKRAYTLSLHGHAEEVEVARRALITQGIHFRHFVVNCGQNGEHVYTEVVQQGTNLTYDTRSYSERDFFHLALKEANRRILLVAQMRCQSNNNSLLFAKRSSMFWNWRSLFTIVLGVVYASDSNWLVSGPLLSHVAPWQAACQENYFIRDFRSSSPLKTPAFWVYTSILTVIFAMFWYAFSLRVQLTCILPSFLLLFCQG
jgi:hypothetical protein